MPSMSSAPVDKPELAFVAEPRADVVLKSSDGHTFPVRRVSLQANSDVFDGMFDAASDSPGNLKDKTTILPLIPLDGTARGLDVLLRFILPKQIRPDRASLPLETAAEMFHLADKYDFTLVEEIALARLQSLAAESPIAVLAVALNQRLLGLTRKALSKLDAGLTRSCVGSWSAYETGPRYQGRVVSKPLHSLSDLPLVTLERLPMATVKRLFDQEVRAIIGDVPYWATFAKTFTFD